MWKEEKKTIEEKEKSSVSNGKWRKAQLDTSFVAPVFALLFSTLTSFQLVLTTLNVSHRRWDFLFIGKDSIRKIKIQIQILSKSSTTNAAFDIQMMFTRRVLLFRQLDFTNQHRILNLSDGFIIPLCLYEINQTAKDLEILHSSSRRSASEQWDRSNELNLCLYEEEKLLSSWHKLQKRLSMSLDVERDESTMRRRRRRRKNYDDDSLECDSL